MVGRRARVLVVLVAVSCVPAVFAQEIDRASVGLPERWLQGYVRSIAGEVITYPWAYPGQRPTLLSRATDGHMVVEWEGEPAPPGAPEERITYLWHAGTASESGAHRFELSVNGAKCATFTSGPTRNDREWSVRGNGGAVLTFKTTRVGPFAELFGFMGLTAPRSLFGAGAPRFAVVGEAGNSQDYYLGPQERVRAWLEARPEQAVLAGGTRLLRVETSHVANAQPAVVLIDGASAWSGTFGPGYTSVLVPAGPNEKHEVAIAVRVGEREVLARRVALEPVIAREIHLLPHSHVDIGYSDPQPEVERKQWKNLVDAVALGRKTADYPAEARFRWNVEGLWSVESYLAQAAPEARQEFVEAVRAGTIGLQANDTNILTGLCTPEELRHWTDGARRLRGAYGFGPIRSAMHTDIPGLSWPTVAALAHAGVRYFSSGPNYMPGLPDGGDRIGGTLAALGDAPFWWVSPSGQERLLFWMAGRGYSWFHGLNTGKISERSRDSILDYVSELVARGYQWRLIQVRYTIGGDNGPVDPELPDVVKAWNQQYETPRLVINTADAMFAELERRHGFALPERTGDMTPYWEDGALSTVAEEVMVRAAARRLGQAQTLWSLRQPAEFPFALAESAWRNVILWHEHTWGAAASVSEPDRADVVEQWRYKRAFALAADAQSRELLQAAAPAPGAAVAIVNTLAWDRTGVVLLSAELSTAGDRVVGADGRAVPSQRLADGRLAALVTVPGFDTLVVTVGAGTAAAPARAAGIDGVTLDNGQLRLELDPTADAVARLEWAGARGRNLVAGEPGLGAYRYVSGRDPAQAVGSGPARITIVDRGPLVASLRTESEAPGARSLVRTVTLLAGAQHALLDATIDKLAVRTKESAHLAFPFALSSSVVRADLGEAVVELESSQLPGSCRDFIGAHSAIDVSTPELGVSLVSPDAALWEPGAITDERPVKGGTRSWREHAAPGSTLFAYLANNYWHTNYKADQQGPVTFRFAVCPHGPFDPVALRRWSDEHDNPLLVFPANPATARVEPTVRVDSETVTVAALRPIVAGTSLLLRLYNPSAAPATAKLRFASRTARLYHSDEDGERARMVLGSKLTIAPHAAHTIRIDPQ
jgi:alpha-mannosidase